MDKALPDWAIWAFFGGTCALAIVIAVAIVLGCKKCRRKKEEQEDSNIEPQINYGIVSDWVSSTLEHPHPPLEEGEEEEEVTTTTTENGEMKKRTDPSTVSGSESNMSQHEVLY